MKDDRTKAWKRQFFPIKEKIIMDEDRPATIINLARHGIKLKEKGNAKAHSRKGHRR